MHALLHAEYERIMDEIDNSLLHINGTHIRLHVYQCMLCVDFFAFFLFFASACRPSEVILQFLQAGEMPDLNLGPYVYSQPGALLLRGVAIK